MPIITDLKGTALASRLLRLGEIIRRDVALIYKRHGIDWEPKWSPVLLVLMQRSPLGVQELADELGYSHPSVVALVREMEAEKLIKSGADKKDGRRRLLSLTPRAIAMKAELQPICDVMDAIVGDITSTEHNLISALSETETLLETQGFYQRYLSKTTPSKK